MKYKCIIFDCDGVLVDSEEISNEVLIEMMDAIGVKMEMEYAMENFTGKSLNSILKFIESLIDKKVPSHFEKEFRERTFKRFKTDLKPIKGIHTLLEKISVPYCVASSGPTEKIKLNLATTGLIGKFENRIFSSYEIGSWKPSPEIFEYAASEMGFKPSECAVIEDSIYGVIAAKRGGFDVFGLANGKKQYEFENEGATVFFEMEKLIDLLEV
ncbi:HAD family hydrolase [Snuella sedimenti]|uniref:HAD family hydrolase n=1 Tax=Snuella sedimenti TaxID=2798802 RepID=A0A8J7IG53_9FLAO|nr:HAD family hydrolase [Snuella sedimenti]MBJ6368762.1 HAD family hydrolase [Snuella sedimenti]